MEETGHNNTACVLCTSDVLQHTKTKGYSRGYCAWCRQMSLSHAQWLEILYHPLLPLTLMAGTYQSLTFQCLHDNPVI